MTNPQFQICRPPYKQMVSSKDGSGLLLSLLTPCLVFCIPPEQLHPLSMGLPSSLIYSHPTDFPWEQEHYFRMHEPR
jgi:hypothetical protein